MHGFISDYLCNVLDDLGLEETETLKQINQLLKATPEMFSDLIETVPQRLAHAISSMRNIEL